MRTPESYARQKELMVQRSKLAADANALGSKEKLTAEEQGTFDRMLVDLNEFSKRIEQFDELDRLTTERAPTTPEPVAASRSMIDGNGNPIRSELATTPKPIMRNVWEDDQSFANRSRRNSPEFARIAQEFLLHGVVPQDTQQRALFAQQDVSGGYLVIPEQVSDKILKKVDNLLWILGIATVFRVPRAMSFGLPTLDTNPDAGDWTTEIAPITESTSMAFGKRVLQPTPVRKRLLVSERLLRLAFDATFWSNDASNGKGGDPTDIIWDRMAYMIAYTWELAFYLGSGTNQPLGLYVASTNGISTARDVGTGSATGFTYAGLINIKFSLKVQYQRVARWDLSRSAIGGILKLVDTAGRPLLNFQTMPGSLPELLGNPVQQSEFTPSTFTDQLYVGMFGDFSKYLIAIGQDMTMKKAEELYAEQGLVGIFAGAECDGMPGLEEAFARIKCSATTP